VWDAETAAVRCAHCGDHVSDRRAHYNAYDDFWLCDVGTWPSTIRET
jgi:hypothetical protein